MIPGRGLSVRREDMKKPFIATRGTVFILQNMQKIFDHAGLQQFRSK